MSYNLVKVGISNLMKSLGYAESSMIESFEGSSDAEISNTFICKCVSGQIDNDVSETLADRFYDKQKWEVMIAFSASSQNDNVNIDEIHEEKDMIIRTLDNPTNWTSFATVLKYESWSIEMVENHLILTVTLDVTDVYTY